jgi:hypothetical protein
LAQAWAGDRKTSPSRLRRVEAARSANLRQRNIRTRRSPREWRRLPPRVLRAGFSTLRGLSRSRKGPWCLRVFFGGHHGTRHRSLLHHRLGSLAPDRSGAGNLSSKKSVCGAIPQATDPCRWGLRPAGLSGRAESRAALRVSPSTQQGNAMTLVILSMCVVSGIVISRPLVRALGLR